MLIYRKFNLHELRSGFGNLSSQLLEAMVPGTVELVLSNKYLPVDFKPN